MQLCNHPLARTMSATARHGSKGTRAAHAGRWCRLGPVACAAAFALILSGASNAQEGDGEPVNGNRSMSLEELEAYVAEQKAALDLAIERRDTTESKAEEVEEKLAERELRIAETQQELAALCEEREAIEPGTLQDCLDELPD